MKKHTIIAILIALITGLTACSDDNYNALDISGEVKILSFTVNGSKLNILDEKTDYIEVIMPSGTDLTELVPTYTLSEGASIALPKEPNSPTNLSVLTTYRVVNKNLYHDYKVLAKTVDKVTSFTDFTIGTYKGVVDNDARTIVVKLPLGSEVTALRPTFNLSEGAELTSPNGTTHNFTNPVKYTISYLGESFTYDVTVELVDFRKMAFLGAPATANDITNLDDKAAWTWFSENFPVTEYISFADIKAGKDLSEYAVIWYHWDSYDKGGDPVIHADANKPEVIEAMNNYLAQGGGLFLSSAGLTLGNVLNITKSGGMWNNAWGFERTEPLEVNDGNGMGWGMRITGHEQHPIYKGIRMAPGEIDRFFLLSNGCQVLAHNVIWNFEEAWTGWNEDVARWENETGGVHLAAFHWDDFMNKRGLITEYPATDNRGPVITTGAEMYDWHQEGGSANTFRDNLEKLTYNILNYLSE
ncbi:DUF4960 domain-containing protein [Bacteroides sp. 224]|uniref:DUF4960 domain-containing protein n=1 Tax=Bacteroides sp. 224 TaxID=2302936 RepID=UPI0013D06DF1|nr:DUF4960 domain-containing protein [Bacteroides sp. 224]NDV65426.1 DUF4960 domain-containing protein [Bacteroides sp. 224]